MQTITYQGVHISIDPLIMSPKMIEVIKAGRYETQESRQIGKIIQEGEVVLEIGAGIGFISTLIARNPLTRRVVSYEANPSLITKIQQTLTDNIPNVSKNWEVRNAVLMNGQLPDSIRFYVHKDFWASSLEPSESAVRIEQVRAERFNAVLADLKPTMIVCDIEGGELDLFKNADLSGVRKVYMEVHQRRIGRRGMKDLFNYFHARDFHYDQSHSEGSVVLFSHVDRK